MGLAQLREKYPALSVEVLSGVQPHDLMRGATDLAVRMFRPSEPTLVARKLGDVGWSIYSSDAYLARRGRVEDLETLEGHEVVAYDESLARTPGAAWLGAHAKNTRVTFRGNGPRVVAQAVEQGMGVSVIPCFVAASAPQLRRLTSAVVANTETFLVVHPDLKDVPRVRAVMDQVIGLFERDEKLFSGLP